MDVNSLLNDSSAQRQPRLHASQTTYDTRAIEHNRVAHEAHHNRPASYPPPLQTVESRGPVGPHLGYPSPHQAHTNSASTHASTPSGSTHSVYAQSPVSHPPGYPPRENTNSQNSFYATFSPSTSVPAHQPPTPNSVHSYQSQTPVSAHPQTGGQQLPFSHSQSPRGSHLPNGQVNPQGRTISPQAQYHHQPHQPVTPLGPPISYNKISPQAQRPPSQGREHSYRRGSHGSAGSTTTTGREYSQSQPPAEVSRPDIAQRHSLPEADRARGREKSISVSPKTIPKPSPQRQTNPPNLSASQRPIVHAVHDTKQPPVPPASRLDVSHSGTAPQKVVALPPDQTHVARGPSAMVSNQYPPNVPQASSSAPSSQDQRTSSPALTLKRNASHLSESPGNSPQPRKRLRRNEIPVWANSARQKPPRFGDGSRKARVATNVPAPMPPASRSTPGPLTNGHSATPSEMPTAPPQPEPVVRAKWEPTIANEIPEDDLSRSISGWIYEHIGNKVPPTGAMFEIEAKVGEIIDTRQGQRLNLPCRSETIFLKEQFGSTKFESSMNAAQHEALNKYLNNLAQSAYNDPERESVRPCHLRQFDDFYELSEEGIRNLNPAMRTNNRRQTPRVRVTTDQKTGEVKARIVKTRLADLEIYNPNFDFDFRISISLESAWEGEASWLVPTQTANARTRLKDRMSYRHAAIQVDLTQVSHEDTRQMEHELEVEVSVTMLQIELEKQRSGLANRYFDLVKSLIDNTRLLCRKGSLPR